MPACIITQCINRYSNSSITKFFKVPSWTDSFQATRRHLWARAIEEAGFQAQWWTGHICGAHFISGAVSLDADSDDFVPSLFFRLNERPTGLVQNREFKDEECLTSRKRKWKRPRQTAKAEGKKTKKVAGDSTQDVASIVIRKSDRSPSKATTTPEITETSPEWSKIETKTESDVEQTTLSSSSSYINPADLTEQSGKKSIVRLKRVVTSTGIYQCEKCCQVFTGATLLVKHIRLHEGHEESFMCEICGENYASHSDLSAHQANHPKIEPGFLCNICQRCFVTPETLKNHKLLHFKDDKKCLKSDVKTCSQINHVPSLPVAEAKGANEKKVLNNKLQTIHLIQVQKDPDKTESRQKRELLKITVSSATRAPAFLLRLPTHPPIFLPPLHPPSSSSSLPTQRVTRCFHFPAHRLTSPRRILPSPSVNMSPPTVSTVPQKLQTKLSAPSPSLTTSNLRLPSTNTPPAPSPPTSATPEKASLDLNQHDNTPPVYCDNTRQTIKSEYAATEEQISAADNSPPHVLSPSTRKSESNEEKNGLTPATPKEENTSEGADSQKHTSLLQSTAASRPPSMPYTQVITKPRSRKLVVLLRRVIPSAGSYRCEKCSQTFTTPSLLVKHMSHVHEGKSASRVALPANGVTAQQIDKPKIELTFPCNICDRSFGTPQSLKRHKLLHVKDDRKCLKCGAMFCRRHKHIAFLPPVGSRAKKDHQLPVNKPQNLHSPQTQQQGVPKRVEPKSKPPPPPAPPAPPVLSLVHFASSSSPSSPLVSSFSLFPCPPHGVTPSLSSPPQSSPIQLSQSSSHLPLFTLLSPQPLSRPPASLVVSSLPAPLSIPLSQTRESEASVTEVTDMTRKKSLISGLKKMVFSQELGHSSTRPPVPPPLPEPLTEEPCISFQGSNSLFDFPELSNLSPPLKMFSPECLTSAFFEVKRNYRYIADKSKSHQKKHAFKVEPPEQPIIPPLRKQCNKPQKVQRIAYDFEFII